MNRRTLVQTAAALPVVLTTGCLPIFGAMLRLGARGGLIRAGARASQVSSRGTLGSFGRAGATALHLARVYRIIRVANSLQRVGEVFGSENGETAIDLNSNDTFSECLVDGVVVTTTRLQGVWLEHYSHVLQISVGTSRATQETVIQHRDNYNRFVGADVLDGNTIKHIDENGSLRGVTPLTPHHIDGKSTVLMVGDDAYLRDELKRSMVSSDDSTKQIMLNQKVAREAQLECLSRPNYIDCNDLTTRAQEALVKLEKRFS